MIQHDALPSDPDNDEIFRVPEELNIAISAFIKIFQQGVHVGNAVSLEKIPYKVHSWIIRDCTLLKDVDLDEDIEVKTILYSAEKLRYIDAIGWLPYELRSKPLQVTTYAGMFDSSLVSKQIDESSIQKYEYLVFYAKGKGETE